MNFWIRIFVSHYRIFDRYRRQVVSLAILTNEKEPWRPAEFYYGPWGCEMQFRFPVIKLLDFRKDPGRLQTAKGNPYLKKMGRTGKHRKLGTRKEKKVRSLISLKNPEGRIIFPLSFRGVTIFLTQIQRVFRV